jgi:RNA polymerase sigma-70 factor (ECF subfamily)
MAPYPLAARVLLPVALADVENPREFVNRTYEAERLVIFRYLLSLGLKRDDALDLTQETFLKLYRAVGKGDEIRSSRSWLFAAASRVAADYYRDRRSRALVPAEDVEGLLESVADRSAGPEAAALQRERLAILWRAFRELSPQQKMCVHLRAEGLRYREIADVLGVAVPTVSEFMRRATARLRSAING